MSTLDIELSLGGVDLSLYRIECFEICTGRS